MELFYTMKLPEDLTFLCSFTILMFIHTANLKYYKYKALLSCTQLENMNLMRKITLFNNTVFQ